MSSNLFLYTTLDLYTVYTIRYALKFRVFQFKCVSCSHFMGEKNPRLRGYITDTPCTIKKLYSSLSLPNLPNFQV